MEKRFSEMIQLSAKGSLILVIGQIGSTIISAIGTIIVARVLGATSYGIIAIAEIPISLLMMFINNGITSALIKYLAENRYRKKNEELSNIILIGFSINLSIGLLATLTIYVLAGYISNQVFKISELEMILKILSVSLIAQALMTTTSAVLVGFERMGQRSYISIFYSIVKSIAGPSLVFLGYGVIGAAIGYSIPYLAAGVLGLIFTAIIIRSLPSFSISSLEENTLSIIRYSYPLFLSRIFINSLYKVFDLILPLYVTAAIIGNFSAAIMFKALVRVFITPINTAIFPLLSKLKPEDSVFEFVFQSMIKYQSMVIYPIAVVIFALSDQLVDVFYGKSYFLTPLFLKIEMLNFVFAGFGSMMGQNLLNSQKETKVTLRGTMINIAVGAPMGFLLIPRYHVVGLQITQIVAPKISLLYVLWWINKKYNVSVDYRSTFMIIGSALIGYILCIAINNLIVLDSILELIIGGFVFLTFYLLSLPITGALTYNNLEDIYSIVYSNEKLRPLFYPIFRLLLTLSRKKSEAYNTFKNL